MYFPVPSSRERTSIYARCKSADCLVPSQLILSIATTSDLTTACSDQPDGARQTIHALVIPSEVEEPLPLPCSAVRAAKKDSAPPRLRGEPLFPANSAICNLQSAIG